jgi:hypothetical protein
MLDFLDDWLPQTMQYAMLIAGKDFWRVWIDGDRSITSVMNYGELIEQFFGDLHSLDFVKEANAKLADYPKLCSLAVKFVADLDDFDRNWGKIGLSELEILKLEEWADLKKISRDLITEYWNYSDIVIRSKLS